MSIIFQVLATESPLSSFINYRFIDILSLVLVGRVECFKPELLEICYLIVVAKECGAFLSILILMIKTMHANDKETGE